jgi:glycosyltransferase involved in cell wall biosynthesis
VFKKAMSDLVSVVIPSYNRYEYCCRAVESVLAQTYTNFEIIVVDDASTDPRYHEGKLQAYPKTRVIHLEKNLREVFGVSAAQGATRDMGIAEANGVWIAFLDDDDVWMPQKLEVQLQGLSQFPEVLFCCSNYYKDEPPYNPEKHTVPFLSQTDHVVIDRLGPEELSLILTSAVLIHKSIIDQVGHHTLGNAEDHMYWAKSSLFTSILYIGFPLVVYDAVHSMGMFYHYE